MCCSVLQRVAACCSVLQCVAVHYCVDMSQDTYSTCIHQPLHTFTHIYTNLHILHISTPYTYLHISTHIYTHLHTFTHIYTYLHTFTHIYTHLHPFTPIYTHLHTSTHIYTYSHIFTPYTYLHKFTSIYIHLHTFLHHKPLHISTSYTYFTYFPARICLHSYGVATVISDRVPQMSGFFCV